MTDHTLTEQERARIESERRRDADRMRMSELAQRLRHASGTPRS